MEFHWARNAGERHYSGCGDRNARGFANDKARLPDEARFFHQDCPRRRKKPLAVAARFVLACVSGHLDDFPYREFVHNGGACAEVSHPQLQMEDYGGNRGANVVIRCPSCGAKKNISRAMGQRGAENLPACRGRHPHLSTFENCAERPMVLVVGVRDSRTARTRDFCRCGQDIWLFRSRMGTRAGSRCRRRR
ncbi:MAG: hypothetical protein ACLP8X_18665 [Streptosporangiaceae bacterium]